MAQDHTDSQKDEYIEGVGYCSVGSETNSWEPAVLQASNDL